MKTTCLFLLGLAFCWGLFSCTAQQPKPEEVIEIINRVNNYWQETHPQHGRSFWDNAAYHTGNMEVFFLTGNPECYAYSEAWAEHNEWKGAKSGSTAMGRVMIMCFSVIIRFVSRLMRICIP